MATHLLPPSRDHDDDGLDQLLAQAAPPVAVGDDVDAQVQALLQAARPSTATPIVSGRRRTLRRRLVLGAGAVVLAASGASMAAANDDTPLKFLRDNAGATLVSVTEHPAPGRCAAVSFDLSADRGSAADPAFQSALAYVASLSVEDIDPTAEFLEEREELVTEVGDDGKEIRTVSRREMYGDEVVLGDAYGDTIWDMIGAHLAAQGLETGQWSSVSGARLCNAPAEDSEASR